MNYIIAIDGPAGSGKSTISKIISKKYNLLFLSTGKYYRALSYLFNKNKLNNIDENFIALVKSSEINLKDEQIFLNDENITNLITDDQIQNCISLISSNETIRDIVNDKIRVFSKNKSIIMDGRDIGTVVFPEADLKIYLTASSWVRAKRRKNELVQLGKRVNKLIIWFSIIKRDYKDKHRKIAPLKKAKDAIEISSTKFSIDQVVNEISKYIKR